jgi:hypothetical protein
MEHNSKSGLYFSNKFARIYLLAFEEVIGKNDFDKLLELAGLSNLKDDYPVDDLDRVFDFADISSLYQALEEMVGSRGSRGFAQRVGRILFTNHLKNFGALAGLNDPDFKILPLDFRVNLALVAASRIFSKMTDQHTTIIEKEGEYIWVTHNCPNCWGRRGLDKPVCFITVGLLQALLTSVSNGLEYRINEMKCQATGDESCEVVILKEAVPA